jgi:hypothetical protein
MSENEVNKGGVKKVSISDFIEGNYKLISTLAFLTALTAFAGNLPLKSLGHLLSFLGWVASVLIWGELLGKFPPGKQSSASLLLFRSTLGFIGMVIQAYCLIEFASLWGKLFYPIFFFLSAYILIVLVTVLIKVSPTYRRITLPIYKRSKRLFWGIHVLCILLVWLCLWFVTPQLNRWLVHIRERMEETNASPSPNPLPTEKENRPPSP